MEDIEKIKLPSNWSLVTPDNLWKHIITIAKTGSTFTKEQIIAAGLYTKNDDAVSRNLSYLKYLGFVEEERGKGRDQKFKVSDNTMVKDLIYELKANREDSARNKFKLLISNHEIFQVIKNDFFGLEKYKTFIDFEHFLKDSIPGKSPQYYQNGGMFIIDLFKIAGLVSVNGNDITLSGNQGETKEANNDMQKKGSESSNINMKSDDKLTEQETDNNNTNYPAGNYIVTIKTPNINFNIKLESDVDVAIVNSILEKVKKELNETKKD